MSEQNKTPDEKKHGGNRYRRHGKRPYHGKRNKNKNPDAAMPNNENEAVMPEEALLEEESTKEVLLISEAISRA